MKKIKIFLTLILCLTLINVNASSVEVNGGTNIYESGGSGTATFDKITNTLTLDNYEGDYIAFSEFDGKTINIVVKGTCSINTTLNGISTGGGEEVTLNITGEDGAKLLFEGGVSNIILPKGTIAIDNVDIQSIDTENAVVFLGEGDSVSIKNSSISVDGEISWVIDGVDIEIYNTTFDIENTIAVFNVYEGDLYVEKSDIIFENVEGIVRNADSANKITFKKSTIIGKTKDGLMQCDDTILLIDSTMDVESDGGQGFYCAIVDIQNSDIKMSGFDIGFWNLATQFTNSKVTFNSGTSGFVQSNFLIIKDSNVEVTTDGMGAMVYERFEIDNSNVSIESTTVAPVIVLLSEEPADVNDLMVVKNVTLREKDLFKVGTALDTDILGFHGYAYSYADHELGDAYDDSTILDLFGEVTNSIHFDTISNPKTGDNLSYYITLMILSIMTLSSCYYVLRKEY